MFTQIMVPVDLEHEIKQDKTFDAAAKLSLAYKAPIHLVSVIKESRKDKAKFLEALIGLARQLSELTGAKVYPHPVQTDAVGDDLNPMLEIMAEDLGIDLIVMASHVPGFWEHIFASHAGYLASHSKLSVFVVR